MALISSTCRENSATKAMCVQSVFAQFVEQLRDAQIGCASLSLVFRESHRRKASRLSDSWARQCCRRRIAVLASCQGPAKTKNKKALTLTTSLVRSITCARSLEWTLNAGSAGNRTSSGRTGEWPGPLAARRAGLATRIMQTAQLSWKQPAPPSLYVVAHAAAADGDGRSRPCGITGSQRPEAFAADAVYARSGEMPAPNRPRRRGCCRRRRDGCPRAGLIGVLRRRVWS